MGIRTTLNKSLVLPISALALAAVVLVSIFTYQTGNAQLEQRIHNLAQSSAVLFEDLLWQMDNSTIEVLLEKYVSLGAVTAAQITAKDPDYNLQVGDSQPAASSYRYSHILERKDSHSTRQIGILTLEMSYQLVWDMVRTRILETLAVASLAVLATTFIIQYLLNNRLVEPVLKISNGLDNWHGDWHDFKINLGRNEHHSKSHENELDRLVSSIHGMRDQILAANRIIETKDERLLSAARIAGIGYASFDLGSGKIVECDDIFASMSGQTVGEMMVASSREDMLNKRLHADDFDQMMEIRRQLAHGIETEGAFRIANATGDYRHIRQLFTVASRKQGESSLVLVVAQDVTELNRLQSTLVHAQKVKNIGNLTGGVAHDFNNILAVISGNLELLEERISEPLARGYVQTSFRAVKHGAELTHQLLAFARKQPLQPEVLDPSRLIRDSLSLLRTSVGESVDLEVVTDGGLWRTEVDKTQLEAAIMNLVINARDAMPNGGKLTIEVGNTRLDRDYSQLHYEVQPGQYVCIAITDSGCGMSAMTISQAMEPFFTTKDVGKGTGLGLSMAYGFVKQSGGHLKIYSEIARGTTVKLYLPRAKASQEAPPSPLTAPIATRFHGLHVFLVEDNDELRQTFTLQLEEMGALVNSASDGNTAFRLAPGIPQIDLILCDVILPNGMKGPEVVAGLKDAYPDAAVIYMSGYTENAIIHQGRLDDGVIMLQKPFSRADLVTAFTRASEAVSESLLIT
ncbi:hybrid sensor histidine kinase/response regulator [Granulosicoccus antarcticus]|uniref:histidine kinase n=1 Tax=Granulosicoccus antarcticus IMCC3135 TaxID=1192854 RepID=A0A2Z2NRV6_9GAMM|nr:PAS domain-containing sensor histidine kinase [Granulosicoccus antarcticus]ASJ72731.1 Blue-light-activated protein [Granulosicoccus antarcticus IMCC3135]